MNAREYMLFFNVFANFFLLLDSFFRRGGGRGI